VKEPPVQKGRFGLRGLAGHAAVSAVLGVIVRVAEVVDEDAAKKDCRNCSLKNKIKINFKF
jgi:hypothetical protein